MNLIGNAVKHARRDDAVITITARDAGDFYEFAVARQRAGHRAPQYHERIWGIFQTLEARDKVEGTGIGLVAREEDRREPGRPGLGRVRAGRGRRRSGSSGRSTSSGAEWKKC